MNKVNMNEIIVPENITVEHLNHQFLKYSSDLDPTCELYCYYDLRGWFEKYMSFVTKHIENKRAQYSIEKWNYLRQYFDKETTYKEYQIANYNWYEQTQKEKKIKYYQENKEKINEKREQNKEKIKEREKMYRENNKEKIHEKNKRYIENNREKIIQQKKIYREKISIKCECGGRYVDIESSKLRHFQTKLHQKYLETKT